MTDPIQHELTTVAMISGDEFFDVGEFMRRDLVRRLLHDAPCLGGRKEAVKVTSEPCPEAFAADSYPHSRLLRAKALCPTPDTCSLLRKADR
ncbi:hypothetical protein ACH4S8_37485 [Streptomyces sp. NPDC021080]|uniref:hypothetical protein n=1 Tax=Streptomyces sp. NPDC021080 TaxID=3365110 RepID=UPI00379FC708